MELIDKAAVVVEIKRIYNEDYKFLPSDLVESVQDFKDDLLIALDTLEVKETDDAYKQGYNDAIDKACKWLKYNFNMPDDFESHLKKAMEGNNDKRRI